MSKAFLHAIRVPWVKWNYARVLRRIRAKARRGQKIRVAFPVPELAKWKYQRVFEELAKSSLFDPFIAVMDLPENARLPTDELDRRIATRMRYFADRGMPVRDIWKKGSKDTISARELKADIVFYQQPWGLPKSLKPFTLSRHALTFYLPYFTPSNWDLSLHLDRPLHHLLYGYIVQDENVANTYASSQKLFRGAYSTRYLPLGHPSLDDIPFAGEKVDPDGPVIYAPHFSIEFGGIRQPCRFSTFLENGRQILEYAKSHPNVRWAFKPHPGLRRMLLKTGAMTQAEVDAYYGAWEKIGESCQTGPEDYYALFRRSRALITDCCSFLTEYGCTGKPIVWLVSGHSNFVMHPNVRELYATYYQARNLDEMYAKLDAIVVKREDSRRAERLMRLKASGLANGGAGKRIVSWLEDLVRQRPQAQSLVLNASRG